MSSREISIWIDERWYDALTRNLKGDTLEERLEEFVDQMCNQLPEHEYERISREIWQEQQERKQEQEAARKFAVFHLVENAEHSYLQVERSIEMLDAARMLRAYRRHSTIADTFGQTIHAAQEITQEQFNARVHERLDNTGKKLVSVKKLLRTVLLYYKDLHGFYYFKGRKTLLTGKALSSSSNAVSLLHGTGVDYFAIGKATSRTLHLFSFSANAAFHGKFIFLLL